VKELSFRPYYKDDLSDCARFAAEAWPSISAMVPEGSAEELLSVDVELARQTSTWLEVACISGRIAGFLFGRINRDFNRVDGLKAFFSSLVMGLELILGKHTKLPKRCTFMKNLILSEIKFKRNSPKSDAEVLFFVVESKHRGKRIGRALMDRFISAAKNKKVRTIILSTDALSNWRFYEKYGFKRYSEFKDDISSYIEGEDVKGFVYLLEIEQT